MPRTDWLSEFKTQLWFAPRRTGSGQRRLRFDRPAAELLEPRILLSVTAYGDTFTVLHDRTLSDPAPGVLENDVGGGSSGGSGGGSGSLAAVLVDGPDHSSSFTLNSDGSFSYTPTTYWVGTDSFTYYATDGVSNSNTATASISVTNNPPYASADSYSFWYDSLDTAAQSLTGVLGNDSDYYDNDLLTAVLKTGPSYGSVTLNANGSFVYMPTQSGWAGTDSFTYAASDGVAESSPATVTITRSNPFGARRNNDDSPVAEPTAYGGFAASRLTGELQVERQVAPGVSLVHSGLTQSNPIISVDTSFVSGAPLPTSIEISLSLGGVTKPTVYYSTSGLVAGDSLRFALQIDDSTLATGRHAWQMTTVARYSSGKSATRVFSGHHDVVNLDDSGFGPGWNLADLDRLVAGTGGVLYVTGRGRPFWFANDGSGGYVSPAGPLAAASLTLNVNGSRTLRDKYGNKAEFSAAGLITARVDRNGNTTSYTYTDADGDSVIDELSQITDPFGRTITFTYTSGRVSSVTDFASRSVTLGRDGSGRLTSVTLQDPDGAGALTSPVWSYAYTSGRLTSLTDPLSRATTFEYDFAGRLKRAIRPDTNDHEFSAVQKQGLIDTGAGIGTQVNPAPLYKSTTTYGTYTDERNYATTFGTDRFGLTTSSTDALSQTTEYARNTNGRVTRITEPSTQSGGGYAVTDYEYDTKGNLTRILFPGNAEQTWVYDTTKSVPTSFTNELNQTWTYTYDVSGNRLTETDPLGKVTTWTYNSRGQALTVTLPDPDGSGPLAAPVTGYQYDSYGRLTRATNADSTFRTFTYNTADNLLTETDELGHTATYAYDTLGRRTGITLPDPDGTGSLTSPVETYAYDAFGNVVSVTGPLGAVTTFEYDNRNRMWRKTLPDPDGAGSLSSPVYTYAFDGAGNLTGETDPLGRTTNHEYDAAGRRTKTTLTDPDGTGPLARPFTTFQYDAVGRLTTVTAPDPDGAGFLTSSVTTYGYNLRGWLTSVTDPTGAVTAYGYDAAGRRTSTTLPDPDGYGSPLTNPVSSTTYDAFGRVLTETDPLGNVTAYEYDGLGRRTKTTLPDPDGSGSLTSPVTTYVYDIVGNLLSVTDPLGKTTTHGYDDARRLTSVTDPLNHATAYVYDNLGRLTSATDANSGVTTYVYDAAGRRTSLTDPVGNTTTWTFDALGRVTAETNELNKTRIFEYDAAGQLTQRTDRRGLATTFVYDGIGRLKTETWIAADGVTTVNTVSYGYDLASRLTSVSDSWSAYTFKYDAAGRVTEVDNYGTAPNLRVILTNTYDAIGRRTRVDTYVNGYSDLANGFTYDAAGRTTRVEQFEGGYSGGGSVAPKRVDLAYDALGRYTSITRYEDLAATLLVATTTYAFDAAGRLTALDHKKGTTNLANYSWTFDDAGRLTQTTSIDGTTTYTYDVTDQLTGADHSYQTDESYSYDANGNRTNTGYSTNANNRLASDGIWNYAYDDEGNRTSKTKIATGEKVEYAWDHRNRLTQVTYKDALGAVMKQVTYRYDVEDRRIAKDVDDNGDGTADRGEWYVYDGQHIMFRTDRTGTITNRYLHGPEIDQIFADQSTSDGLLWSLADQQGTIRDWADYNSSTNATTVIDHLKYDSFGNITSQSSATHKPLFAYTGREWDADAGMYYYRARWYEPASGRFMSEDPIGFSAGDANVTRYVANSPTLATDPTGLFQEPGNGESSPPPRPSRPIWPRRPPVISGPPIGGPNINVTPGYDTEKEEPVIDAKGKLGDPSGPSVTGRARIYPTDPGDSSGRIEIGTPTPKIPGGKTSAVIEYDGDSKSITGGLEQSIPIYRGIWGKTGIYKDSSGDSYNRNELNIPVDVPNPYPNRFFPSDSYPGTFKIENRNTIEGDDSEPRFDFGWEWQY